MVLACTAMAAQEVASLPAAQQELAVEPMFRFHQKMQVEVQAAVLPCPQPPFAMAVLEVPKVSKAQALRSGLSKRRQGMSAHARSS
jgi:hypothetical protein